MKKVLFITIIFLLIAQFIYAKETFYSALESKESVEKEGGTVMGGEFDTGKLGKGFKSVNPTDVITFPVEGRFTNLKEGTVELFLTLGIDAKDISGELFMFITYKRGTDALDISWLNNVARARIKSANTWYTAASPPLEWKKGETHHIANTWGPDGLKLYLDGKLAAENGFKDGPTLFSTWIAINNVEPENAKFPSKSVVDEVRIFDHQKKANELILDPKSPFSVVADRKGVIAWGGIKK